MTSSCGGGLLEPAAVVLSLLVLAAPAGAQGGRAERPAIDPYTQGRGEALERAGYVRFGPFRWVDDATTEKVEEVLGGVPLLWVETEHFKLGSSLDGFDWPDDRDEKKRLQEEFDELKRVLPGLKRPKTIDPWLRLHLFAYRLEKLYDEFLAAFGLADEDFPAADGSLGKGPNLGLEGKFLVLLVLKRSTFSRYTSAFCGTPVESSFRYFHPASDTLFFGMCMESLEGAYATDAALHFAVVFSVVQNLQNGFRGYTHEGPLWWNLGLARWFARRTNPSFLLYTAPPNEPVRNSEEEKVWEPKVRSRVEHDYFPTMDEMLQWTEYEKLGFADHMMLWSKVDYLMSLGPKKARAFLQAVQSPVLWDASAAREATLARQFREAIPTALGLDHATFDASWSAWVKATYPKK